TSSGRHGTTRLTRIGNVKMLARYIPRGLLLVPPCCGAALPLASGKARSYRGIFMSTLQASAQKQLRQFVEQIERLEEEKKQLASDSRDKYAEAKAVGFDVKAQRQIVRLRKKSNEERQEEESI